MTTQSRALGLTGGRKCAPSQAPAVFAIFVSAQLLDGGLTYLGVNELGIGIEGNVLLATVMGAFGAAPALLGAKTLACLCGLILYLTERHRALAAAAGIYVGAAVGPWLVVLTSIAVP